MGIAEGINRYRKPIQVVGVDGTIQTLTKNRPLPSGLVKILVGALEKFVIKRFGRPIEPFLDEGGELAIYDGFKDWIAGLFSGQLGEDYEAAKLAAATLGFKGLLKTWFITPEEVKLALGLGGKQSSPSPVSNIVTPTPSPAPSPTPKKKFEVA